MVDMPDDGSQPDFKSTVMFGGFDAKDDKIVIKFYFMRDYRTVGELFYEIPPGSASRAKRMLNAHKNIRQSLRELTEINNAMLESANDSLGDDGES